MVMISVVGRMEWLWLRSLSWYCSVVSLNGLRKVPRVSVVIVQDRDIPFQVKVRYVTRELNFSDSYPVLKVMHA